MRILPFGIGLAVIAAAALASRRQEAESSPASEAVPFDKAKTEQQILAVLEEMREQGRIFREVPVTDGRMLRLLTEAAGARRVLEIGTSTGHSGLWFCLALANTGGKLTTLEYDTARAAQARSHFSQAGVESLVDLLEGDAHLNLARVAGPFDLVFIDAEKEGYLDYLDQVMPKVRPGGLILAHNVDMVPDYVERVTGHPGLETVFYMDGKGLAVTLKKR